MRTTTVATIQFPFSHFVWDPHYHQHASLEVAVSAEMVLEERDEMHMMGADGVNLRFNIERDIAKHLAGRYLVWQPERDAAQAPIPAPSGFVVPPAEQVLWPIRPTVEGVMLLCAVFVDNAVKLDPNPTCEVEYVSFSETARTTARLEKADFVDAVATARTWFSFLLEDPTAPAPVP
jgi:hypothetical protein